MCHIVTTVLIFSVGLWMKQKQNLLSKARTNNELGCECLSVCQSLEIPKGSHLLGFNYFFFLCTHFSVSFSSSQPFWQTGSSFPCLFSTQISQFYFSSLPAFALSGLLHWDSSVQQFLSLSLNTCLLLLPSPHLLFSRLQSSLFEIPPQFPHVLVNLMPSYIAFFTSQTVTPPYSSLILGFLSCSTFWFCHTLCSPLPYCFIAGRFCRLY